eukprot:3748199-Amphidinium_carterae.1
MPQQLARPVFCRAKKHWSPFLQLDTRWGLNGRAVTSPSTSQRYTIGSMVPGSQMFTHADVAAWATIPDPSEPHNKDLDRKVQA